MMFALISIHALLAEGDYLDQIQASGGIQFLSTPSSRRATVMNDGTNLTPKISIHALLAEGDRKFRMQRNHIFYFYPRPPRGGRLFCPGDAKESLPFLSTPSSRRATSAPARRPGTPRISIHALLAEGDGCSLCRMRR